MTMQKFFITMTSIISFTKLLTYGSDNVRMALEKGLELSAVSQP